MKKTMKIGALLLAMMMVLALAACGGSGGAADDPNLGVYKLNSLLGFSLAEYAEMVGITEEEAAESMTLELKADGTADMVADGDTQTLDWTIEGDKITLTDGTDTLEGTVADGVITLDAEGVEITFAK